MAAINQYKIRTIPAVEVVEAGTAVPLSTTPIWVTSVTVTARASNVGRLFFGDENVDTAGEMEGTPIPPSEYLEVTTDISRVMPAMELNLQDMYLNATSSGDSATIVVIQRVL